MKAVVCQNAELRVEVLPDPVPAKGHALLKVLACGICGSDLHMRHHCNELKALNDQVGYAMLPRADQPFVFGHEICGEVADYGPGSRRKLKPGTRVVAQVSGQTVQLTTSGPLLTLELRLNDALLDLDQPVRIELDGKPLPEARVERHAADLWRSLTERADPASATPAHLSVLVKSPA